MLPMTSARHIQKPRPRRVVVVLMPQCSRVTRRAVMMAQRRTPVNSLLERLFWSVVVVALGFAVNTTSFADGPRARALGIPFDGAPGQFNAITDVAGVTVGYSTLIEGEAERAVRTGVTAVLPRGKASNDKPVFAG